MKTLPLPGLLLSGLLLVLMSCSETPTGLDPADSNLYGAGIDARVSLNAPQGRDIPLVRARFRPQRVEVSINEAPPVEARFRGQFTLTDSTTSPRHFADTVNIKMDIGDDQGGSGLPGVTIYLDLNHNGQLLCEAGKFVLIVAGQGVQRGRGRPSDPVPVTVRIAQLNGESTGGGGDSFFDIDMGIQFANGDQYEVSRVAGQLVFRQNPCETAG